MCSAEPAKHTMEGHRKPLPGLYVALTRASSTLTVLSAGSAIRPAAAGTLPTATFVALYDLTGVK